jgi:hypothetical protein
MAYRTSNFLIRRLIRGHTIITWLECYIIFASRVMARSSLPASESSIHCVKLDPGFVNHLNTCLVFNSSWSRALDPFNINNPVVHTSFTTNSRRRAPDKVCIETLLSIVPTATSGVLPNFDGSTDKDVAGALTCQLRIVQPFSKSMR